MGYQYYLYRDDELISILDGEEEFLKELEATLDECDELFNKFLSFRFALLGFNFYLTFEWDLRKWK